MQEKAALTICTETFSVERNASLRLVLLVSWEFLHQLVLAMGEVTFVTVLTFTELDTVAAEFSFVLSTIDRLLELGPEKSLGVCDILEHTIIIHI
jgi:hypothetical protein